MPQYFFVDESGEPGFHRLSASPYFVLAMVQTPGWEPIEELSNLRKDLHLSPQFEFHYSKMSLLQKQAFYGAVLPVFLEYGLPSFSKIEHTTNIELWVDSTWSWNCSSVWPGVHLPSIFAMIFWSLMGLPMLFVRPWESGCRKNAGKSIGSVPSRKLQQPLPLTEKRLAGREVFWTLLLDVKQHPTYRGENDKHLICILKDIF